MDGVGSTLAERVSTVPLRKSASAIGRSMRVARQLRQVGWPACVRDQRAVYKSSRMLTGLRAIGAEIDRARIDIRSRHGFGFFAMARCRGNPLASGATLTEATLNLAKQIAPAASRH